MVRHYGLLANTGRKEKLAQARERLRREADNTSLDPAEHGKESDASGGPPEAVTSPFLCPACGAPMLVIDIVARGPHPRDPPAIGQASG